MNIRIAVIGLIIMALTFAAPAEDLNSSAVPARLGGISINVSDLDRATAYYKMIGLVAEDRHGEAPKRTQYMNINATKATFNYGGLVLHEDKSTTPYTAGDPNSLSIFLVADAKAVCQRLADAKMPCDREPRAEGPTKVIAARAHDPDGRSVEFIQLLQ